MDNDGSGKNGSGNQTLLVLDRDGILSQIDSGARTRRNVSAGELLRAYQAGKLEDPGEVVDLLALADLLEKDDLVFVDPPL